MLVGKIRDPEGRKDAVRSEQADEMAGEERQDTDVEEIAAKPEILARQ
jgi:hypothetical protein